MTALSGSGTSGYRLLPLKPTRNFRSGRKRAHRVVRRSLRTTAVGGKRSGSIDFGMSASRCSMWKEARKPDGGSGGAASANEDVALPIGTTSF